MDALRIRAHLSLFSFLPFFVLFFLLLLLLSSTASSTVGSEWCGLYPKNSSRSGPLSTFQTSQNKMDNIINHIFREIYGWDILKIFDDWDQDAAQVLMEIKKVENVRKEHTFVIILFPFFFCSLLLCIYNIVSILPVLYCF